MYKFDFRCAELKMVHLDRDMHVWMMDYKKCLCPNNLFCSISADKQQEIDVPDLKVEDTDAQSGLHNVVQKNEKKKKSPMSQISGVRKLKHTNSFTGVIPKWGVETNNEEQLANVSQVIL